MALPDRCVAHPSRPAVDRCPVCDRPRCGADATGPGCAVCHGVDAEAAVRTPSALEVVVRAALAAHVLALVAGVVLQEYPGSPFFQYVAPAVGGAAVSAGATAAAGEPRGPVIRAIRVVVTVYAVLAVAFGFSLEGTYDVLEARGAVLLPYLCAGVAALLWTRPPRRRVRASEGS
jgi:hypothetical protein